MTEACYIYCITEGELDDLKLTGVNGEEVYSIGIENIQIVLHNCLPTPYEEDNDDKVREWVVQHNKVVEKVWERQDTVIPLTFDTIIKGDEEKTAQDNVRKWIKSNFSSIKNKLKEFKERAEYIIQVIINNEIFFKEYNGKSLLRKNNKKKELTGIAYLKKKKKKRKARQSIRNRIEDLKQSCYLKIADVVIDIVANKYSMLERPEQMILNLSVLAGKEEVNRVGNILEEINDKKGIRIRFTGPWPCYSFVNNFYENK